MELGDCQNLQDADYTLYRVQNPQLSMREGHVGQVFAIEHITDSGLVATGGADGLVKLWDPLVGKVQLSIDKFGGEAVLGLLYLASERVLVAGTATRLVHFDGATGELLKETSRSPPESASQAGASVLAYPLSYLEPYGLIAAPMGGRVDLWKALELCADGKRPRTPAECEACPANLAGFGGACQIACRSGNSSNANRTACEPCALGYAGTGGICEQCQPGKFADKVGLVSCRPCRKGTAQPSSGRSSCVPCVDNTASQILGQERCEECPDGTEPVPDNTRCVQCPEGRAGRQGSCFRCADGRQPSPDLDVCLPCEGGTAGTGGLCDLCPDGSQPTPDLLRCEFCPIGFAGTKGYCARCQPGQTQAEDRSFCMSCPPGQAGTDGTCSDCPPGYIPNDQRIACIECEGGQPSYRGVCLTCEDGTYPADNRTMCLQCPVGYAGTEGTCAICPFGTGTNEEQSACEPCADTAASSVGVCYPCPNGTQPSADQSFCEPCPAGRAGPFGRCEACLGGQQQDDNRSRCEPCPLGRAGLEGICDECAHPLMQNESRMACTLQLHPPYFHFFQPDCSAHPECTAHFRNLPAFMDEPGLFCCPTPEGEMLDCCQFETPMQASFWDELVRGLESFMSVVGEAAWFAPLLSFLFALGLGAFAYRALRSEDWEEWREQLVVSWVTYLAVPLPALLLVLASPWLVLTMIGMVWFPFISLFLMAELYKRIDHATCDGGGHMKRLNALRALRVYAPLFVIADACSSLLFFLVDWLLVRFLLADLLAAVNVPLIKPLAFEQVPYWLDALPRFLRLSLRYVLNGVRAPQVQIANFVVHVDLRTTRLAMTLFVAAAGALTFAFTAYVLLVANVQGRLSAARQSILTMDLSGRQRVWRLMKFSLAHLILALVLRWIAIMPARLTVLLWQLAPTWIMPGGFGMYAAGTTAIYVVLVQFSLVAMWVVVSTGSHVDNPPGWIARLIQRFSDITFDVERRDHFMIHAVLRALELAEEEDDEEDHASTARGSPRGGSPRSGGRSGRSSPRGGGSGRRGRSGRSGGGSPRGGGSGRSPKGRGGGRGGSPRAGRSPGRSPGRGGGGSPRGGGGGSPRGGSPRGGGGNSPRYTSPRKVKLAKNLGSVSKALKRQKEAGSPRSGGSSPRSPGRGGSPRGGSPRGGSPRSGRTDTARMTARTERKIRFIRMPDGTRVPISRMIGRGSPRSGRSPRGGGGTDRSPSGRNLNHTGRSGEGTARSGLSGALSNSSSGVVRKVGRCLTCLEWLGARCRKRFCCKRCQRKIKSDEGEEDEAATKKAKHSHVSHARELLNLANFEETGHFDDDGEPLKRDLTHLKVTPQVLYNRLPQQTNDVTFKSFVRCIRAALRTSLSTCLGQWSEHRNVGPHRVQHRTRLLARESNRHHFDGDDYLATQLASASTVATSLLWLPSPVGFILAALTARCNRPALRQCDRSLDILLHKIAEFEERGVTYKQAEIALKRSLYSNPAHERRHRRADRCLRLQKMLNLGILACLVMLCGMPVQFLQWNAQIIFLVAGSCALAHAIIEHVFLPMFLLPNAISIQTRRPGFEEKEIEKTVAEALGSDTSSNTVSSSTEYSSANDSFLDEDPRSENLPSVLGYKRAKVVVRPKGARLRMRLDLLRGMPACDHQVKQWDREDPYKYGRLLRVPGAHLDVQRRCRTLAFSPTDESDMVLKAKEHRLIRSRSLGTITPSEEYEWRMRYERWAGFADIFEEGARPGPPTQPRPMARLPNRGVVDVLEAQGAFREQVGETTNQDLFFMSPLTDVGWVNSLKQLAGAKPKPKPWEESFDEALHRGYEGGDEGVPLPPPILEAEAAETEAEANEDGEASPETGATSSAEALGAGESPTEAKATQGSED
eukprot:TRINITY_DN17526_c0_g4_i1.p1 TRINITY_DN17526_c0_g4~~TRINITY_DN17526_c0_g4_i1.p1  ORF type:complete len:2125 (+),score=334.01 TRINITY_DN17526_c0_g4_i1:764-6376(+)